MIFRGQNGLLGGGQRLGSENATPVELDLAKNETDSKRLARSRTATYKFLVSESATAGSAEAVSTGPLQPRQASSAPDPPHGITQPAYMCRLWEQPGRG